MEFFNELYRCSPVCGTFQIAGNSQALEAVEKVYAGLNIKHPSQLTHLKAIQEHAPVLADVLLKCTYRLPKQFLNFFKLLKSYVAATFDKEELNYTDAGSVSKLSYFPNHPPVRGVRNYSCDSKNLMPTERFMSKTCFSSSYFDSRYFHFILSSWDLLWFRGDEKP